MTLASDVFSLASPLPGGDLPRPLATARVRADRIFRGGSFAIGMTVLIITGAIGLFLGYQAIPTLHRYGTGFLTGTEFNPQRNKVGIASVVVGTIEVAVIALAISFPLALATALYITQYAPRWIRTTLVTAVDLMAAIPSIVYGVVAFFVLEHSGRIQPVARFFNQYLGFLPFFHVTHNDPNAASWSPSRYDGSAFIAGVVVSLMVIPLAAAVMRNIFDLTPAGEREAALALGATKWGMIRTVVLPFGRGGIVGGTMLGLGRALGETIAVYTIISSDDTLKLRPLEAGTDTVASLIARRFGEATAAQLSALLAAGFVLFLMTMAVNTVAGVIVNRSRSGAETDI